MSRRRFRRSLKRVGKNLLWVYNTIDITAVEANPGVSAANQSLMNPSDWQATFGLNFERATLMRIVGNLCYTGSAGTPATLGDGTFLGMAVVLGSMQTAFRPGPNVPADIIGTDILWVGARNVQPSNSTSIPVYENYVNVDIKTKRRLNTDTDLSLVADVTSDPAVSVQARICGILRVLVQTN